METNTTPNLNQIKEYLDEYGWKYREDSNEEHSFLTAPLLLPSNKGILLTFNISGDFVMVSTYHLLNGIKKEHAIDLLGLNDTLKLVKMFSVPEEDADTTINAEIGFELCYEAWEKYTFFTFLDMLAFAVEKTLDTLQEKGIEHTTEYIKFVGENQDGNKDKEI